MKLSVRNPGMLTTVQDLGRWGFQQIGMPVAGAMDADALRIGDGLGSPLADLRGRALQGELRQRSFVRAGPVGQRVPPRAQIVRGRASPSRGL